MLVRIATALVLLPLAVYLTLVLPALWFALVLAIIFCLALYEWRGLCELDLIHWGAGCAGLFMLCFSAALSKQYLVWCVAVSLYWVVQGIGLFRGQNRLRGSSRLRFLVGVVLLWGAWCGLMALHINEHQGPLLTLIALSTVWAADSGAYFVGKFFGRRKLLAVISPNKTIEGVIGGVALAMGTTAAMALCFVNRQSLSLPAIATAAFFSALISVVGDLYQSRLKRSIGVQDSGSLIPGHGGILDRIDGLIAAAPLFAVIFYSLQRGSA